MKNLFSFAGRDMAVDLGTANTLVFVRGQGIVLNEPSVLAIATRTNKPLEVGPSAQRVRRRTPTYRHARRPVTLVDLAAFRDSIKAAWHAKALSDRRRALDQLIESVTLNEGELRIRYAWKSAPATYTHQTPPVPPATPMDAFGQVDEGIRTSRSHSCRIRIPLTRAP